MPTIILRILVILIGLALLTPAPITLVSPKLAADAFGVPAESAEAQAYLMATATRDVALGVWLLSMLALGANGRLLAASLWSIAIVASGDALNVANYTKYQNIQALAPHIAGCVVLCIAGWLYWRSVGQASSLSGDAR